MATQPGQKRRAERNKLFRGRFIHATELGQPLAMVEGWVAVDKRGSIVHMERQPAHDDGCEARIVATLGWNREPDELEVTVAATEHDFFFPGFIDTHIHASQYPNAGIFGTSTLLDWLQRFTLPLEASLGDDPGKARRVYKRVVERTLSHGTTCAVYFATIDVDATKSLADICLARGQRALVGRVCMDSPETCPAYYRDESAEQSVARTNEVVRHIETICPVGQAPPLVRPVVTPRFAPSCTEAALRALAALANDLNLPIQTHVSENTSELDLVRTMFPDQRSYARLYDAYGLLGPRTILAHAIYLSEEEIALVGERGAKVSHCPCSNACLGSGIAPVRRLLDRGIVCGLGTDVSGGYSLSVLEAARQASLASRLLAVSVSASASCASNKEPAGGCGDGDRCKLSVEETLWMATRGGAEVVGLKGVVGGFDVGMEWDAQLVRLGVVRDGGEVDPDHHDGPDHGNVDVFGWETWEQRLAKWVFSGDDRNTKKVWVRGRLVHERA